MTETTRIMGSNGSDEILRQQLLHLPDQKVQKSETSVSVEAVQAVEQVQEDDTPLSEDEKSALKDAIEQLDQLMKPLSIGLSVQRIESLNRLYVRLLDRQTGETIREIPPRKILAMKENIKAYQGLIFDKFS